MAESSPLIRPTPRRPFDTTAGSTPANSSPAQSRSESFLGESETPDGRATGRTRSVLNLTASTLFGIYSPSGNESILEAPSTPWGTGALTPLRQAIVDRPIVLPDTVFSRPKPSTREAPPTRFDIRNDLPPLTLRIGLLFVFGIAYGLIIAHLHDNQGLAPVKVENIDRSSWRYLILWGVAGVFLGGLLPVVDIFWEEALDTTAVASDSTAKGDISMGSPSGGRKFASPATDGESWLGADWNPAVRSIGAFIGIAFAIVRYFRFSLPQIMANHLKRKLPWQSSLQVSLTLALVNPFLWYLIDRSKPGFFLSSFVGITGTAVLLGLNPEVVPSPPVPSPRVSVGNASFDHAIPPLISPESIYVWTWIASVLFCSCVCFGNIGRRLALQQKGRKVICS